MAIVTISRQIGSFGDEIAQQVSRDLGLKMVGREDLQRLQSECDAEFKNACQAFESEVKGGFFERLFFREPANTSLFAALVYELAAEGEVIILGRGAQIVLGNRPAVLKVRVVAAEDVRVARVKERSEVSAEDAAQFLKRVGHQRRSLIESVFHQDLADWSLYDMVLNTTGLSSELGASLIAHAAQNLGAVSQEQREEFADLALAKRVEAAIKKKLPTTPFRDVEVMGGGQGKVILTGVMTDKMAVQTAEEVARKYAGVTSVENELKTTELSF
jgi:Cytidylate kinase-like family/BON domain